MKFPNLVYAISLKRMPHYQIAHASRISEWRFSRLLNGRSEAAPAERNRIAEALGFDETWLFEVPRPPSTRIVEHETVPVAHSSPPVR
jgi:hypothetical protein